MTEINIAAHREDHPPLPYVYYDDVSDPTYPGWVLRREDGAEIILPLDHPDDALGALAVARLYLP